MAKMSNFGYFWAINNAKTKNSKIYSDNFFCILKNYLHANFQENWSKNEGAFVFQRPILSNPGQNPVLLSDFWLRGPTFQYLYNVNCRKLEDHWQLFEKTKDRSITYIIMKEKGEMDSTPPTPYGYCLNQNFPFDLWHKIRYSKEFKLIRYSTDPWESEESKMIPK